MKEKIVIILLLISIVLTSCFQSDNLENSEVERPQSQSKENLDLQTIYLTFTPVTIDKLKEGQPNKEWIKGKSIYFGKLPKQIEATIHLYLENSDDTIESDGGAVYAFLEHDNKVYEIGNVSNYGIKDVKVDLVDRTFDGIKEIVISGGLGATYIETKVIGYNEIDKEWMNLLTMGSPKIIDLDDDGQEELVAISTGSIPGFIEIYRWNQDYFEKVDIAEATGNTYANIIKKEEKWIIESGKLEKGEVREIHFYKYAADKLIEQDMRD